MSEAGKGTRRDVRDDALERGPPSQPWPNTYWVQPPMLLAGEYPGSRDETEAAFKIGLLLDAGMRTFVDLTEAHELEPYEHVLVEEADRRRIEVRYHRMPIRDVSVPRSRAEMKDILNIIAGSIAAERPVYVHCWGGVGRTGIVVGCHLVETGHGGEAALDRLRELFSAMKKSASRQSPETAAQVAWVTNWERT